MSLKVGFGAKPSDDAKPDKPIYAFGWRDALRFGLYPEVSGEGVPLRLNHLISQFDFYKTVGAVEFQCPRVNARRNYPCTADGVFHPSFCRSHPR